MYPLDVLIDIGILRVIECLGKSHVLYRLYHKERSHLQSPPFSVHLITCLRQRFPTVTPRQPLVFFSLSVKRALGTFFYVQIHKRLGIHEIHSVVWLLLRILRTTTYYLRSTRTRTCLEVYSVEHFHTLPRLDAYSILL